MRVLFLFLGILNLLVAGCAGHVERAPMAMDSAYKTFSAPKGNLCGIYIYRDGFLGHNVNTELFLDGRIVGKNLGSTYLYIEVPEGEYTLTSHLSGYTNLRVTTEAGKLYFIHEVLDTGMFATKLTLKQVDSVKGKQGVLSCRLVESAL